MDEETIQAKEIASVTGSTRAHALEIAFRLADDSVQTLVLPLGAVPKLAVGIHDQYSATVSVLPQQEWIDVQPLKFRGANRFQTNGGQKGINIHLDIYQVHLILEAEQVEALISELELLRGSPPDDPAPHLHS